VISSAASPPYGRSRVQQGSRAGARIGARRLEVLPQPHKQVRGLDGTLGSAASALLNPVTRE